MLFISIYYLLVISKCQLKNAVHQAGSSLQALLFLSAG